MYYRRNIIDDTFNDVNTYLLRFRQVGGIYFAKLSIVIQFYMHITFHTVYTKCKTREPSDVSSNSGYLSSHVADTKGCGSSGSPWIISANPGQTIQLDLVDFATNSQTSNLVSCRSVYGFILERALGINHTICGRRHREGALYTSKTNSVEINLSSRNTRGEAHFLVKYEGIY